MHKTLTVELDIVCVKTQWNQCRDDWKQSQRKFIKLLLTINQRLSPRNNFLKVSTFTRTSYQDTNSVSTFTRRSYQDIGRQLIA